MAVSDIASAPRAPFAAPADAGLARHFVIFRLDQQAYALPLAHVTRALRMVAVTPVPEAPAWMPGIINMAGQVVPVVDLRRRFGQPGKAPALADRLLIVETQGQTVAVSVDEILNVLELPPHLVEAPPAVLASSRPLTATLRHGRDLILVLDADRLLPPAASAKTGLP